MERSLQLALRGAGATFFGDMRHGNTPQRKSPGVGRANGPSWHLSLIGALSPCSIQALDSRSSEASPHDVLKALVDAERGSNGYQEFPDVFRTTSSSFNPSSPGNRGTRSWRLHARRRFAGG
jgi:hypothetical protein